MYKHNIIPGKFYQVKTNITGPIICRVFARENDNEFPFEITAARFGITEKEIIKETTE